jgi:hypothetical protein
MVADGQGVYRCGRHALPLLVVKRAVVCYQYTKGKLERGVKKSGRLGDLGDVGDWAIRATWANGR